jgi:hypothetical protein
MNGKISFAIDCIAVLSIMNEQANGGKARVSAAASLMFLVEWGLNLEEITEANKQFLERVNNHTIDDFATTSKRIVVALQNREEDKKRFMGQLATIAVLDNDYTDNESSFYQEWGTLLDFKPSEMQASYDFGKHAAYMLRNFALIFHEEMKSLPQA